jgi:transcriptional regulator with PAS, ATPase and Fis domain
VRYRIDGQVSGNRLAKTVKSLVGGCQMDHIAADIERIAPTELSCVILGETGTGKEVVANELHRASGRKGSFQAVNCAAIPQNLLESELFGYRRGAFSGADRDKPGLIKLADGGTLLLDEIGDMPLEAQAKLLRVLQAHEVFPLGATTPERVNIRVVCATHRDLHQFVSAGKFRGDLFARLNEHAVKLPPLRERKEDIYQLSRSFAAKYGKPNLAFTFSFLVALTHYDWPFNVRELESCIKRGIALVGDGQPLDTRHLPDAIAEHMKGYGERPRVATPSILPPSTEPKAPDSLPLSRPTPASRRVPTEEELRGLLSRHHGNVAAVGRELGKERMQVHRWLKRYQISLEEYRDRA